MKTKKLLSVILSLCMLLMVVPIMGIGAGAQTGDVSYLYPTYVGDDDASSGIAKWNEGTKAANEIMVYQASNMPDTIGTSDTTTWCCIQGTGTKSGSITVKGKVHLILLDGCNLTVGGIIVNTGNSLTIYSQSTTEGVMGEIKTTGSGGGAGIGGTDNQIMSGRISINGGKITAIGSTAASGHGSAGIGAGSRSKNGVVVIDGGIVSATGGNGGAGIGSGHSGNSSTGIYINGGDVTAKGGSGAACIGGGYNGVGEKIFINGGTVNAVNNSDGCAGIGGGYSKRGRSITITGGIVTAKGGSYNYYGSWGGAGIGGGGNGGYGSNISITGGTVIATGGNGAAGIGNGHSGGGGSNITISGGDVTAYPGNSASALGAGYNASFSGINIDNTHVTVTANTTTSFRCSPKVYSITKSTITNGTVTVQATAGYDETVTVTPTANAGYGIDKVYYNDGTEHEITPVEGVYSFKMPASEVTVSASFVNITPKAVINAAYYASLTLNENIDVNFSMEVLGDDFELNKLSVNVDGADEDVNMTLDEDGNAVGVLKSVAPYEMGKALHVVITYDGVRIKDFNYSILSYCNAVYNTDGFGKESDLGKLCTALINYGKWAEDYYNEVNGISAAASTVNAAEVIDFDTNNIFGGYTAPNDEFKVSNKVSYAAGSLTLGSAITLNFHVFTTRELTNENIFIRNNLGEKIEPSNITVEAINNATYGAGYIIKVNDICASKLSRTYTLTINGVSASVFKVVYGVESYCYSVQGIDSSLYPQYTDTLKTLCKAIFNYAEAAKAFEA